MDIALAKEFIYCDQDDINNEVLYISTDLHKVLDKTGDDFTDYNVFGVVDTPNGEKLFHVWKTSCDYILGHVFVHKKFYMDYHIGSKIIILN